MAHMWFCRENIGSMAQQPVEPGQRQMMRALGIEPKQKLAGGAIPHVRESGGLIEGVIVWAMSGACK